MTPSFSSAPLQNLPLSSVQSFSLTAWQTTGLLPSIVIPMVLCGLRHTVVVFLAGHGVNAKGGRYLYLPTDVLQAGADGAKQNAIDWQSEIQQAIIQAKGRRLMFVDACHSGSAHNRKLLSDALTDRFVAFAATSADQGATSCRTGVK